MNIKAKHIITQSIRIFLMVFWLYVSVDKLLELDAFHAALQRQPLATFLTDLLYWLLPLTELLLGLLFIGRYRHYAYLLSAILLFSFSVFIALGLVGFYPNRPCGCASVFSRLSWSWHLVVNLILLILSILGWYLTGPTSPMHKEEQHGKENAKDPLLSIVLLVPLYHFLMVVRKRFPEKFALFPAWAGIALNYDT
ncbi:MauE/DoxX family redox-associated membrane protein [Sphingobacterium sp. HMA12]|uniref:MauE/DoxX family redox-associated membrane protein n=1 Tax=Sphingobacterium sp. HMA12 TaxID=2050894 RepID=UPI000CE9DC23|nr:MauE/DoxX family redox-associated membrane protein [Sphingobacterium sp. HMA12]